MLPAVHHFVRQRSRGRPLSDKEATASPLQTQTMAVTDSETFEALMYANAQSMNAPLPNILYVCIYFLRAL